MIPETESIKLVGYKSYFLSKVLFFEFKDIYFLERTSLFVSSRMLVSVAKLSNILGFINRGFMNCKGSPRDFFTTFDHVLILCLRE